MIMRWFLIVVAAILCVFFEWIPGGFTLKTLDLQDDEMSEKPTPIWENKTQDNNATHSTFIVMMMMDCNKRDDKNVDFIYLKFKLCYYDVDMGIGIGLGYGYEWRTDRHHHHCCGRRLRWECWSRGFRRSCGMSDGWANGAYRQSDGPTSHVWASFWGMPSKQFWKPPNFDDSTSHFRWVEKQPIFQWRFQYAILGCSQK